MAKRSSRQKNRGGTPPSQTIRIPSIQQSERSAPDPASLPELPTTYQALNDYVERAGSINPFALRIVATIAHPQSPELFSLGCG
jgi:hypothetical protein